MSNKHQKAPFPTLADVPSLPPVEGLPSGFRSAPEANGEVLTQGFYEVAQFCKTYHWPDPFNRKIARACAKVVLQDPQQFASIGEAFDLDDTQKAALRNAIPGPEVFLHRLLAAGRDADGDVLVDVWAYPMTVENAREYAFKILLFDLHHGAVEGSEGAVAG